MEKFQKDESIIDLMDMLFFLLKRWKSLVVFLMIGGIIGCIYSRMQPMVEPVEYVPSKNVLIKMEQAAKARELYETILKSSDATSEQILSELYAGQNIVQILEKDFAGEELTYYQVHYLGMATPETVATTIGMAKSVVIGTFFGVVLWGAWYLVNYATTPKIKTAEEMYDRYGIVLLGRIPAGKEAKGLSKQLLAWQEKARRPAKTASYLATIIDSARDGSVSLCGDGDNEIVKGVMNQISSMCSKVKVSDFISESEDALNIVKQTKSEVFVIQTWNTNRNQILRELEMCRIQNVTVLGFIAID